MLTDYAKFFELLIEIVNAERPYQEKKQAVIEAAEAYGDAAETALDEFVAWFE